MLHIAEGIVLKPNTLLDKVIHFVNIVFVDPLSISINQKRILQISYSQIRILLIFFLCIFYPF